MAISKEQALEIVNKSIASARAKREADKAANWRPAAPIINDPQLATEEFGLEPKTNGAAMLLDEEAPPPSSTDDYGFKAVEEPKVEPTTSTEHKKALKHALKVTTYSEIDPHPTKNWLVKDFIGADDFTCLFGPPGCGKSCLVGDLACHVAAGRPWFGRQVKQGAVLFVVAERAALTKRRLAAFRKHHDLPNLPLAVAEGSLDLRSSPAHANEIVQHAKDLEQRSGKKVILIIVETANRALAGGDENASKDMGALIANLDLIQRQTGAAALAVHHVPADGSQRMRGHSSLLGACDVTIHVEQNGSSRSATTVKVNDGLQDERLNFILQSVDLSTDPETNEITTAPVVIQTKAAAQQERKGWPKKLHVFRQALLTTLDNEGQSLSPFGDEASPVKAVPMEVVRAEFFKAYPADGEDAKRKAFDRHREDARNTDLIGTREIDGTSWIWMGKS
jgi:hypothetical protein